MKTIIIYIMVFFAAISSMTAMAAETRQGNITNDTETTPVAIPYEEDGWWHADGIDYKLITNTEELAVVDYLFTIVHSDSGRYQEDLEIPENVIIEERVYTVAEIENLMWCGFENILIPNTIRKIHGTNHCSFLGSIILPESVNDIIESFNDMRSLKEVILPSHPINISRSFNDFHNPLYVMQNCKIPYALDDNSFKPYNSLNKLDECVLMVPEGCVQAYAQHESWSRFGTITDGHETVSVRGVVLDNEMTDKAYFNLNGIMVDNPHSSPGLYIVKDGVKAYKTIIK